MTWIIVVAPTHGWRMNRLHWQLCTAHPLWNTITLTRLSPSSRYAEMFLQALFCSRVFFSIAGLFMAAVHTVMHAINQLTTISFVLWTQSSSLMLQELSSVLSVQYYKKLVWRNYVLEPYYMALPIRQPVIKVPERVFLMFWPWLSGQPPLSSHYPFSQKIEI